MDERTKRIEAIRAPQMRDKFRRAEAARKKIGGKWEGVFYGPVSVEVSARSVCRARS